MVRPQCQTHAIALPDGNHGRSRADYDSTGTVRML